MAPRTDHHRPVADDPLPTPADLRRDLPLSGRHAEVVGRGRRDVARILDGRDDRLLVVVGPCSVHDPEAVLEYAARLAEVAERRGDALCLVLRAYVEKPRTTLGWRGLVHDPFLDGSGDVAEGLASARRFLRGVLDLDVPAGAELVDPVVAPYLVDALSWGAVGARTVESPVHRQLASGLALPVGFKNSTGGGVQAAVDAVVVAATGHVTLGIGDDGRARRRVTDGNPWGHVVLRGSERSTNFAPDDVADARGRLARVGHPRRVLVDASHGNSGRDHRRQADVVADLAHRVGHGEEGVAGVMLESFLMEGRQRLGPGALAYGQSVTDACLGWSRTVELLDELARATERRRAAAASAPGCRVGA
jgi:3-deoxy-7-phosphoheptulonate synthase